jgi:hypothetical protein
MLAPGMRSQLKGMHLLEVQGMKLSINRVLASSLQAIGSSLSEQSTARDGRLVEHML